MAGEIYSVQGERSTLGIGKETTFGTLATPTLWQAFQSMSGKPTIAPVALTGARGSLGMKYSGTGGRSFGGSLSIDGEVDTIGQPFAYTMGKQTTPSTAVVNTTMNGATLINATSIVLTSTTNVYPGMTLTCATATGVVANVQGLTVNIRAPGMTAACANSAAVTCTGTLARASTMTMGSLPSFSMEIVRAAAAAGSVFLADDFLGCKFDGLTLAFSPKKGLDAKFNFVAKQMVKNTSPTAATISTKYPMIFDQQLSTPMWNAIALSDALGLESTVIGAQITVNNNLKKDNFGLGSGNTVRSFPEMKRSVSGTISMNLESTTAHDAFQAAKDGGMNPSVALTIPMYGTDIIDAAVGIPYANTFYLPNCFITSWDPGDTSSGAQTQTITFEAAESAAGAADGLTIYHIGSATAVY